MAEEKRLTGHCASPGLARGKVLVLAKKRHQDEKLSPDKEKEKLSDALAKACAQLRQMMDRADKDAAAILEFQVELAGDESLTEDAFADISQGAGALEAWHKVMDDQLADYASDQDEYFKARGADLADLRDRVSRALTGAGEERIPDGSLVHAKDMAASEFLSCDWEGGGVILAGGSVASHVAMLARARNVPMVVGVGSHPGLAGRDCMVDAQQGVVVVEPGKEDLLLFEKRKEELALRAGEAARHLHEQAKTAGGERVQVAINVASVEDTEGVDPNDTDGIGLARTEFLFKSRLAGEQEQHASYLSLVKWAQGKPVTIRTLDAGGDKPIPGYTADGESNPFLGLRGLRLSLARPEVFAVQLKAILRAAEHGPVKVMLPMVTSASEFAAARELYGNVAKDLGVSDMPPLGMMVEVPAAAMMIESFDADFYSIGSNDLTQYVSACGRDVAGLDDLALESLPAVLELVAKVVEHGNATGKEVSLCGEMAGDPERTGDLLGCGLRSFSMASSRLGEIKAAIANWK